MNQPLQPAELIDPASGTLLAAVDLEIRAGIRLGPPEVLPARVARDHDLARLAQIDCAGEEVLLLLSHGPRELELLRLRCATKTHARTLLTNLIEAYAAATGQAFPAEDVTDYGVTWCAPTRAAASASTTSDGNDRPRKG